MTSESWQQIKELFEAALERGPTERAVFLAQACAGNDEVRQEVESLLKAHEADSGFMNTPVGHLVIGDKAMLTAGQHFGPYEEIQPIGEGGMGQVYLAVDTRLGRKVALKLLPSSHTHDADRVRRFGQEARAASALNHPNIVTIHEIGQVDSLHFIATEFVAGETLREHMLSMRMTLGEVLDVAAQIASALQAAHEAGIVHRDVKPENIMLRHDGFVKVLDFGLAKLAEKRRGGGETRSDGEELQPLVPESPRPRVTGSPKTDPGVVMGTAAYMSPEQARGADVDARTDVWSLGVVLYEMVAGRAPFAGETPRHLIVSILESELPPLSLGVEVPTELERIISKALRKEKKERYQSARDMAHDLKSLREELTVESRLKEFRRSDLNGRDKETKSDAEIALNTADATVKSTTHVERAGLTSSAEYLVNGIKRHSGSAAFVSVTAILLIAFVIYFSGFNHRAGEATDSVAVLPFVNEGGAADAEYLSSGISDSVVKHLAQLPNLKVISLNGFNYKRQSSDPQAIGSELNARAVLSGTITQHKDGLTISAELVDARNNRVLWSEQYNRQPSDFLAGEIASEIAQKLRLKLVNKDAERLSKRYTENSDAYDAYLRGRFLLEKRTPAATEKSVKYLEQAVELDPNYALAYATLSYAYWSHRNFREPQGQGLLKAKEAAAKALALDPMVAETYSALGHIKQTERDWTGAGMAFKRATELDPNSGFAHSNYAFHFIAMKRFDEAVATSKRAVELEPTSVLYNRNVAMMLYFARRYDEAITQAQKTLELNSDMPTVYLWLSNSYEQKGLYDQAVEALQKAAEFPELGPEASAALREAYAASGWKGFWRKTLDLRKERAKQNTVSPLAFARTYARLGEIDRAFAWLEKAYENGGWAITTLNADPVFDVLRSDPRYADLVRRMGLEP